MPLSWFLKEKKKLFSISYIEKYLVDRNAFRKGNEIDTSIIKFNTPDVVNTQGHFENE